MASRVSEAYKDAKELFQSPYTVQALYFLSKLIFILPIVFYFATLAALGSVDRSILPPVNIDILPDADRFVFFGYLPHQVLASLHNVVCDLLSGAVYLYHFSIPLGLTLYCFFTRQSICFFFFCLGLLNFGSVILQLNFPTAPPWFYDMNPNATFASWETKGSPADLARLDELFGIRLYTSLYGSSTLVFGSWPSLHVGWPMMCMLFTVVNKHRWVFGLNTVWVSLAAIYLRHHYFVDVLGGMAIALACFAVAYSMRAHIDALPTKSWCCGTVALPGKKESSAAEDVSPLLQTESSSSSHESASLPV